MHSELIQSELIAGWNKGNLFDPNTVGIKRYNVIARQLRVRVSSKRPANSLTEYSVSRFGFPD